jgi:hypothetical protein
MLQHSLAIAMIAKTRGAESCRLAGYFCSTPIIDDPELSKRTEKKRLAYRFIQAKRNVEQ